MDEPVEREEGKDRLGRGGYVACTVVFPMFGGRCGEGEATDAGAMDDGEGDGTGSGEEEGEAGREKNGGCQGEEHEGGLGRGIVRCVGETVLILIAERGMSIRWCARQDIRVQ